MNDDIDIDRLRAQARLAEEAFALHMLNYTTVVCRRCGAEINAERENRLCAVCEVLGG